MMRSRGSRKSRDRRVQQAVGWIEPLESRMLLSAAPQFTSGDMDTVNARASFSFLITTTGTPAAKITESGSLPSGVRFTNNGDGTATIAGVPASASSSGVYNLILRAKNSAGTATQAFTLDVNEIPKFTGLPTAVFNTIAGGSYTITTSPPGFAQPSLSASNLPSGVTFTDNGDGTGTITVAANGVVTPGYYDTANDDPVMITATNSAGSVIQDFSLTIDDAPTFTSAAGETLTLDQAGDFQVTTSGFPISTLTYSGNLPKGMTFVDNRISGSNAFSGSATIAGTPLQAGTFPISIFANNRLGNPVKQVFVITVDEAPGFTTVPEATFKVGKSNKYVIKTQGFPPAAMSESGALPSGVSFVDDGDGVATLLGIPAAGTAGTYHFTVFADGGLASQLFTLNVV